MSKLSEAFKGGGYLVSSVSVILLGVVTWKSASEQPVLLACLILGMAASIAGMLMRFLSFKLDEKDKKRIERKAEAGPARPVQAAEPANQAAAMSVLASG